MATDYPRTLFLLHQSILEMQTAPIGHDIDLIRNTTISSSALDSAARMMAAVAKSHTRDVDNIDMLPLTAAFNVKIAIKHFEMRPQSREDGSDTDLEALRIMEAAFRKRWNQDALLSENGI